MLGSRFGSLGLVGSMLAVATGCGDPLADGEYRGEVLAYLDGTVFAEGPQEELPQDDLEVALFWLSDDGERTTEQPVVTYTRFPAQYTLEVHHPPPPEALFSPTWSAAEVAVAFPLLYEDTNGNGAWDEDSERVVGGSAEVALVWSSEGSDFGGPASTASAFFDLRQGFQRMWANAQVCAEGPTEYFPAQDAPVNLFVGPFYGWVNDWDCDGDLEEWVDLCPPFEEMLMFVEEDIIGDDPFLSECAIYYGLVDPETGVPIPGL